MEANTLISILHNSMPVSDGCVEQLCDIAMDYPYFALPQSLLAAVKTKNGSGDSQDHIAKAALMVRDRKKLQVLIHDFCAEKQFDEVEENVDVESQVEENSGQSIDTTSIAEPVADNMAVEEIGQSDEKQNLDNVQATEGLQQAGDVVDKVKSNIISEQTFIIPEINLNGSREELAAGMSLLEEKKKSLDELKEMIALRLQQIEEDKQKQTVEQPKRKLTKAELIDKFIAENPSISRHKAEFFNPISVAQSSNRDEENIISETLAKIYANQGFFDKAISTYRNLMLKYPEKSVYFAARIEEIKENQIK